MFRIWPSFARKNFFLVLSLGTKRSFSIHLPIPLFVLDGIMEPLWLMPAIGPGKGLTGRAAKWTSIAGMVGIFAPILADIWRALRWKGSFTLIQFHSGSMRFCVRFV